MYLQTVATILAEIALATLAIAAPAENVEFSSLAKRVDHTGEATVFPQEGGTGSCGQKHSDDDKIVAISNYWMKNESPSSFCGRKIKVTNIGDWNDNSVKGKGTSVIVTVADTCPSCDEGHIDFSWGAWNPLTDYSATQAITQGAGSTAKIEWHFCSTDGVC